LTSLGLSSAQVEQMKRTLWDPLPTLAVSVFKKRADDASKELKEWQQYADSDLRSQLEHARESAAGLHFKMWKALRPANGSRQGTQQDGLGDVANLVGELVVKLRHLLDQAVTRWVNHVRHSGGLDRGQHPCPVKDSVEWLVRWLVEKDLLLAAHLAKGLDKSTFIFLTGDDLKSRTAEVENEKKENKNKRIPEKVLTNKLDGDF